MAIDKTDRRIELPIWVCQEYAAELLSKFIEPFLSAAQSRDGPSYLLASVFDEAYRFADAKFTTVEELNSDRDRLLELDKKIRSAALNLADLLRERSFVKDDDRWDSSSFDLAGEYEMEGSLRALAFQPPLENLEPLDDFDRLALARQRQGSAADGAAARDARFLDALSKCRWRSNGQHFSALDCFTGPMLTVLLAAAFGDADDTGYRALDPSAMGKRLAAYRRRMVTACTSEKFALNAE